MHCLNCIRCMQNSTFETGLTDENMLYTQLLIDYLHRKDPFTLLFFDEAGFKIPTAFKRTHGHAPKGERCVEISRYHPDPNITLNLLVGLDGVKYANIIDGPSNTVGFLKFFEEAANSGDFVTGLPALSVGNTVIPEPLFWNLDNCPIHHNDGERALESFLNDMGIELTFTPTYSPDLNPVEFVFSKIRTVIRHKLRQTVESNLKLGVYEALESIHACDMKGFFRVTGYINI